MLNVAFSETGLILPHTSLRNAPALARRAGVARTLVKLENERPLGNFKVLGGMYAGLRVLADRLGLPVSELVGQRGRHRDLPPLICASDGNHGLSVAAAASAVGAPATIYFHGGVGEYHARRVEEFGASIVWTEGTYDDAVDAALAAARAGLGLLIPDTSSDPDCPVVQHVMQGYAVLTQELLAQLGYLEARLSHSFVQAGVGGLAAALADGLQQSGGAMVVVEPESAACVGHALVSGAPERLPGDLVTSAEMLSCGQASAQALRILLNHGARAVTASEAELLAAVRILEKDVGVETTSSGAAGLAGFLRVATDPSLRAVHGLDRDSTVLLVVTEGVAPAARLDRRSSTGSPIPSKPGLWPDRKSQALGEPQ
jgi:diaminopropionate ammonia-lyase